MPFGVGVSEGGGGGEDAAVAGVAAVVAGAVADSPSRYAMNNYSPCN